MAPRYAEGTRYVPSTGLALLHQGEAVLTRREVAGLGRGGGGGVNVGITINAGGGLADMDDQRFLALVEAAAINLLRTKGGFQNLVKNTTRSGL